MSKEARVNMYGEVFTPPNTAKGMIDLLGSTASETKIQVLEPACGEGIFLIEILKRKLIKICTETGFKRLSLEVLKSLHGIDILSDNIEKTRNNPEIQCGASPRALLAMLRCSQALAYMADRDYCIPEDIAEAATLTLPHRIILTSEAKLSRTTKEYLIRRILEQVKCDENSNS